MDASPEQGVRATTFDPTPISRPDPLLLRYYVVTSIFVGPFFPFVFLPLYFRYHTLRYRFDAIGISMSWGILIRREIHLTYRRIQDIHLTRNIIQRWMGLATVAIQTASGSSKPEMSIEGILEAEGLRDYLYGKMRGARGEDDREAEPARALSGEPAAPPGEDEALGLLREIRDLLRQAQSRGSSKP